LQSYATEAVITQDCDRVEQAKQRPNEDEREFADRLGSYAADAGSVFAERQLIASYLSGLSAYVSATLRGRINPRMNFPEVQAIAEEIGLAANALAASRPLLVHRTPDSFLSVRGPLLQWQKISRRSHSRMPITPLGPGLNWPKSIPWPPRWSTTALKRGYLVRTRRRNCRPHLHALQGCSIVNFISRTPLP
jgi:hypothetical protein